MRPALSSRPAIALAAAVSLLASTALAGCADAHHHLSTTSGSTGSRASSPPPTGSTGRPSATPATSPPPGPSPAQRRRAARAEIAEVVRSVPRGAAGVAAFDATTGKSVVAGSRRRMWTASMYKLLVLETLQREHGALSGYQLDDAIRMIEQSDNAAGYDLFLAGGGSAGMEKTMRALGMRHGASDAPDPTFTELTPADALCMVRALVRPGILSAAARHQTLDLMRHVESDQRWGVGIVADPGTEFANKNGWLAVDNDNGAGYDDDDRWIVTSVGVVTVRGHRVLLAAMTNHNDTESDGITAVQRMAKAAVVLLGDS